MTKYDEEFLEHLQDTLALIFSRITFKWFVLLAVPTTLVYFIGSGLLFACLFSISCFMTKSAKLGGIIGWYIVALCLMLFFKFPETGHFIDLLLRVPPRYGSATLKTSSDIIHWIPSSFASRFFDALLFGLWGGGSVGLGIGMLGGNVLGKNPNVN